MRNFISIFFLGMSLTLFGQLRPIALTGGRVIPADGSVIEKGVVIFSHGKITAVGEAGKVTIPKDAVQIDVSGKSVLPGLIESNGHITFDGQYDHGRYWTQNLDRLYRIGSRNLIATLKQGITTVRDTHGPVEPMLQLKQNSLNGSIAGSRLYACGLILNYGSFSELFDSEELRNSFGAEAVTRASQALGQPVKDLESGKEIIRKYASLGFDFIKISAFSATGEYPPTLSFENLKGLIGEAHRLGLRTTTHALSASSVEASIDAGSDAIEHPELISGSVTNSDSVITSRIAAKMAKKKVYGVPLMAAQDVYIRYFTQPELLLSDPNHREVPADMLEEGLAGVQKALQQNPAMVSRFRKREPLYRSNLKTLIEAKVPIAMGTDRGTRLNYHQAGNHIRELELYVELGMSTMDAILSATIRGAELLGTQDQFGSLTQGKLADIIVVEGNPLNDIRFLANPKMVFKEGVQYH